jgi:NitT/TauT family transport system ATP-binding protein
MNTPQFDSLLLDPALADWLDANATRLDTDPASAPDLLPRLAAAGVFGAGVPARYGGAGDSIVDAIRTLAAVAERSVCAAFVFWGHRTFIEYLLHSPNEALAARLLPDLLAGRLGGATGLSNAMKYLSGIESLQCQVARSADARPGFQLDGVLPWVTNLRREGYVVALAASNAVSGRPGIFAVPHDLPGVVRSPDLALIGLQGSNTAAIKLEAVALDPAWELHPDADTFLPRVRPGFLGLQCGLSLGLARASLNAAGACADGHGPVLAPEIATLAATLDSHTRALLEGVADGSFQQQPARGTGERCRATRTAGAGRPRLPWRPYGRLRPASARSGLRADRHAQPRATENLVGRGRARGGSGMSDAIGNVSDGGNCAVLTASALGYRYGAGVEPVFSDIDLTIGQREIVCLLGGSGCGKSTLLRTLAALHAPSVGQIHFLGQAMTAPHPRAAMVFQQPSLLPWLSVAGNVGFGLDFAHQPDLARLDRTQRIAHAIEAVGLAGKEHAYPAQLSGGMAQRVALARALARQPHLLFADEPFSALDAITRADMQSLLLKLVREWRSAVLLVTHDIDEAMALADRIVLMGGRPGRIAQCWHVPRKAADADALADAHDHLRRDVLHALQRTLRLTSSSIET